MNFDGVWTPVITPFFESGDVNYEALARAVDTLIEQGIHGLIVGGTTGEYYALSQQERLSLFEFIADRTRNRVPLMAGINATTTQEVILLGKHAKSAGYQCLLLPAPYYAQPTQDELYTHACRVDDALDMPTMLYNFPARTGTEMSWEFLDKLKSRPNFQAIKESTGSIERMHTLINDYSDQIQVSCGMDDQILEFFTWGSRSWVGGASNFLASEHVALYQACVVEQDFVKGRELARRLLPTLNLLEQGGKFCQYVKYGCELSGIEAGAARAPLLPLSEAEKADFGVVYDHLISHRG